jgi:hypothetical protein
MGVLDRVPFLAGYNEQDQINRAQENQGLMKLSQLMQMQKMQQEMAAYPEERQMRGLERKAKIGELEAHAEERGLKKVLAEREAALFNVLRTAQPGSPEYKQAWDEMRILKSPATAFAAPTAPKMRDRIAGDKTIQEEFQPDGTWKELSSGPRFARQVAPVINVGEGANKPQFKDGQWVYPPTAENPQGRVVKPPTFETKDERKVRFGSEVDQIGAVKALQSAGYDPTTGKDAISDLIKGATGGLIGRGVDEVIGTTGYALQGKKNNATLKAASSKIVMDMMGGKLGAGINNADRDFISEQLGNVGNPNLTTDERLDAWKFAKQRMIDIGIPANGTMKIGDQAGKSAVSPEPTSPLKEGELGSAGGRPTVVKNGKWVYLK